MKLENYGQLEQAVADADLILIGLGEEWVLTDQQILEDLAEKNGFLYEMYSKAVREEGYHMVLPLLTAYYYDLYIPKKLEAAYGNLIELLKDKNYFLVSLTVDAYLKKMGFEEDRYVNPCGTYKKIQCEESCVKELYEAHELLDKVKCVIDARSGNDCVGQSIEVCLEECMALMSELHCERCGANMDFNLLDTKKYLEEGYLEQWKIYMKWLQGTLNRKLCVIEAGVGMKLPSVIRWPFEKTVFYNQKANMFRIHDKFFQVNEEVAERAYGCECNSVKMFAKKNVEA